jgi:hypothetical protein
MTDAHCTLTRTLALHLLRQRMATEDELVERRHELAGAFASVIRGCGDVDRAALYLVQIIEAATVRVVPVINQAAKERLSNPEGALVTDFGTARLPAWAAALKRYSVEFRDYERSILPRLQAAYEDLGHIPPGLLRNDPCPWGDAK